MESGVAISLTDSVPRQVACSESFLRSRQRMLRRLMRGNTKSVSMRFRQALRAAVQAA